MKLRLCFYYVGDLKEATETYVRFLGSSPIYSDPDWVRFRLEGGDLALHYDSTLSKADAVAPVRYGAVVSFTVSDLAETLDRAKRLGFRLVGDMHELAYGYQAEVRDPWGNRISLVEAPAAR